MTLTRDEGLREKGTWGRMAGADGGLGEDEGRIIVCCPECGVRFTLKNAVGPSGMVARSVACPNYPRRCGFHDSEVVLDEYSPA